VGEIGKFKDIKNYREPRTDKGIDRTEGQAVKYNLKKHRHLLCGWGLAAEKRTQSWKNRSKPGFSFKSKEAVPKAEILEQPQISEFFQAARLI
jgi:hypothetical protein